MIFKNFAEEYEYFVRTHVLPLMGVPNRNIHFCDNVNGVDIFTTVLPGDWTVTLNETPITVQSEVLAENICIVW